jgi:hypothetical protein
VADFVVRMDNLQYLANADLDRAVLKTFAQPAVSFEVASELVTLVGDNGTEVRLEGGSQDELAGRGGSLRTREIADMAGPYGAAGEQYPGHTGRGRR